MSVAPIVPGEVAPGVIVHPNGTATLTADVELAPGVVRRASDGVVHATGTEIAGLWPGLPNDVKDAVVAEYSKMYPGAMEEERARADALTERAESRAASAAERLPATEDRLEYARGELARWQGMVDSIHQDTPEATVTYYHLKLDEAQAHVDRNVRYLDSAREFVDQTAAELEVDHYAAVPGKVRERLGCRLSALARRKVDEINRRIATLRETFGTLG